MIKINLLSEGRRPTAVRKQRSSAGLGGKQNLSAALLLAGIFVPLLIAGLVYLFLNGQKNALDVKVAEATREMESLQQILDEVEAFENQRDELRHKIKVITDLKNNQRGPVEVMDAVSRSLPELLWIDSMEVKGNKISIRGRAYNYNAISNFMENLERVPGFSEPLLAKAGENGRVYEFTLTVVHRIPPPPGAEAGDGDLSQGAAG